MASSKPTLPNSQEGQNSAYNPGEQAALERFGAVPSGQGQVDDASANEPGDSGEDIRDAEGAGDESLKNGLYRPSPEGKRSRESRAARFFIFAQRRGGILGLLGVLGISGGLMAGFFGPASMLINLMENLSITNDSSSTALERRFMKAFSFAADGDPICANNSKNLKCKMGRISNSALHKLNRAGIVPYFDGGGTYDGKRLGYPDRNPAGYSIDLGDGRGVRNIAAKDLPGFLVDNPKTAAKILGRSGAFNLRFKAWTGKYITSKLFRPFNIGRSGGLADGKNGQLPGDNKRASIYDKLRSKIPGADAISGVADGVRSKVNAHMGKAKAGGVAYVTAVAGCIAIKAPAYIAAGVAAVQLSQMLPMASDVILSPGAKAKAAGFGSGFEASDMEVVATLLTDKTPRASDGKMTSALDSPYLLAAMGVNTNAPSVSKEFTPGYSILTSDVVRASSAAEKALEPACNAILSPAAMYTALAVDSALTIATSATPPIIGGVIKVLGSLIISEIVSAVVTEVAGDAAKAAVVELAKNKAIPQAEGEELGDVLGISATALFSAGGMGRNLPTLTEAQQPEFAAMQQESQEFQRQMDIASLSPFDISSRYTFLGSIVNDMRFALVSGGGYGNVSSMLGGLLRLPAAALTQNAAADGDFSSEYCSYADEFMLSTGDPETTPAINMAGLPCTGITEGQANMSTEEAIDLVINEGWIDESKPINDGDTAEDLLNRGYIKEDTPLSNYMETCGHPETGDYIFNSAGCTVNSTTKEANSSECVPSTNESGEPIQLCTAGLEDWEGESPGGVKDPRALEAMAVFLIDYQNIQILNGEDDEEASGTGSGTVASPVSPGFTVSSPLGPRVPPCSDCSDFHQGTDFLSADGAVFSIMDGVVESAGSGRNNIVRIRHADGLVSTYWHMASSDIIVAEGDRVTAGQRIGKMGSVGQSTGVHLHIELDISGVQDRGLYEKYSITTGGFNAGQRIDPQVFFAKNNVEGF